MRPSGIVAGIDVGGTFTDLVLFDPAAGTVRLAKTPTTPENQAIGVLAALDAGRRRPRRRRPRRPRHHHHHQRRPRAPPRPHRPDHHRRASATSSSSAAAPGPHPYGMTGRFTPVIPRDLRLEVPERTDARGRILTPLDEAAIRAAVAHAPRRTAARPSSSTSSTPTPTPPTSSAPPPSPPSLWPNPYITTGHEPPLRIPRVRARRHRRRQRRRSSPLLERYVARLQSELTARGYPRDLLVVTGNGGMASPPATSPARPPRR